MILKKRFISFVMMFTCIFLSVLGDEYGKVYTKEEKIQAIDRQIE